MTDTNQNPTDTNQTTADATIVDPVNTTAIDDDETAGSGTSAEALTKAANVLEDLIQLADEFADHVDKIRLLQLAGNFRYASKEFRNEMLNGLMSKIDILDETTKVTFRALKKVKRERVPDSFVDSLLADSVRDFINIDDTVHLDGVLTLETK